MERQLERDVMRVESEIEESEEFARCGGAIQAMGAGKAVAGRSGWRQWIFHFDALRIHARARWSIE